MRLRAMVIALCLGAGCVEPVVMRPAAGTTALDAARIQVSDAAPSLPVYVLRLARDELSLSVADRAAVAMIVDDAVNHAEPLDRARAAYFEFLARSVPRGAVNEEMAPIYADQVDWASGVVGPYLAYTLGQLYDVLTPEQRVELVTIAKNHYPLWARSWAADDERPRWLDGFARRELSDVEPELRQAGRRWTARSTDRVRAVLPTLDRWGRVELARSLRAGVTP